MSSEPIERVGNFENIFAHGDDATLSHLVSGMMPKKPSPFSWRNFKQEKLIFGAIIAAIFAFFFEHAFISNGKTVAFVASGLLILAIVLTAVRVAHHAEILAEKVGDPYGTMILTLSAVLVEVLILAIMMTHSPSPDLAKNTIFSAVILDVNLILGLAALFGGFKHGEQDYNEDSGRVYVAMILTAVGVSMIMPEFVPDAHWKAWSAFTIVAMIVLYGLFLRMQTNEHSYFFNYSYPEKKRKYEALTKRQMIDHAAEKDYESTRFSILMLIIGVVTTGALAEVMSKSLMVGMNGSNIPVIFVALIVATISASPEILTAMRAAMDNKMQVVINISLGASLSTVILTIPVIEAIALYTGQEIDMALTPAQTVMMVITLVVAYMNVSDGQTNAIEGMMHLILFASFIMACSIGL